MTVPAVRTTVDVDRLAFDDFGRYERALVSVVVQDVTTGAVLMVAWADREAVEQTLATGDAWFWSRSRREPWRKGATSGNTLAVEEVRADCDGDSLLYRVRAAGPACHTGARTCFETGSDALAGSTGEIELAWLWRVLQERRAALEADPETARDLGESSYTARLLTSGRPRVAQKVAEEGAEVAIAAVARALDAAGDDPRLQGAGDVVDESADLLYHLLVLLLDCGLAPRDVAARLASRHVPSSPNPGPDR